MGSPPTDICITARMLKRWRFPSSCESAPGTSWEERKWQRRCPCRTF